MFRLMKVGKGIIKFIGPLLMTGIFLLLFFSLQRLLMPKYVTEAKEGRMIAEYYREERKDFDVLFLGDCEVYDSYSMPVLWKEYGINGYIRGSAKQQLWQSFALLEECMRDHVPKVVVLNVQALQYGEPQEESYNRMTLDGMRLSRYKIEAVKASLGPEETMLSYLFPILRFHDRWKQLKKEDLTAFFGTEELTYNGYYLSTASTPATEIPEGALRKEYDLPERAWSYLEKIRLLCEEEGTTLILVKAPALYPVWYEEYEAQVSEYADSHGLLYLNWLERADETGIDYEADTADGGLHLNVYGAEKLSRSIAPYLIGAGVPDRREDPEVSKIWEKKLIRYEKEKKLS